MSDPFVYDKEKFKAFSQIMLTFFHLSMFAYYQIITLKRKKVLFSILSPHSEENSMAKIRP